MGQAKLRGTEESRVRLAIKAREECDFWDLVRNVQKSKAAEDDLIKNKRDELIRLDVPFSRMVKKLHEGLMAENKDMVIEAGNEMNNYCGFDTMYEAVTFFIESKYRRLADMWFDGIGEWKA